MVHARVFGFLAIILCLVACLCANAIVTKREARIAIAEARLSTTKALNKTQSNNRAAHDLLIGIETCKTDTERAAAEAGEIAAGNPDAEAIAKNVKNASDEVAKLYPNAVETAEKYRDTILTLRTRATDLGERAKKIIWIKPKENDDYTERKGNASEVKNEAETLYKEISDAALLYADAYFAQNDIQEYAKFAQLGKYRVETIVAVSKIETLLKPVESDITLVQQKKVEINATVEEMNKIYENAPKDLSPHVSLLISLAEGNFTSASRAEEVARATKEYMLDLKAEADSSLVNVTNEMKVDYAKNAASTANWCANDFAKKVKEISNALKLVETSVINAKNGKEAVERMMRERNTLGNAQNKDTAKASETEDFHRPEKDAAELHSKE